MNTNTIAGYTQIGNEVVQAVNSLGPELFTVVLVIVIGYGLKFVPRLDNKYIPAILIFIAAPVVYCCISDPELESWINMRYPIIRQIGVGIMAGFGAWAIHRAFLKPWLDDRLFPREPSPVPPGNTHL